MAALLICFEDYKFPTEGVAQVSKEAGNSDYSHLLAAMSLANQFESRQHIFP
jgi:hypothetical protein